MRIIIALLAMFHCIIGFAAYADTPKVKFPEFYEEEYLNYLSVDRANNRQTARLFANIAAMVGVQRFGDFPEGSVLVMEISDVKKDGNGKPVKSSMGRLINDGKYAVYVMQKNASKNKKNNWSYAAFTPKGKTLNLNLQDCSNCHAKINKQKQVFSYDHLEKSELSDYLDRINRGLEKRFVRRKELPQTNTGAEKPNNKPVKKLASKPVVVFDEHIEINKIIERQLLAFRNKNITEAYSLAAPQIRESFHNPDYFMHIVRVAYPQLLNFRKLSFPDLRKIDGNAFSQIVTVLDEQGERHKVRYMMLRINGQWKIAGCSIL